MAARASASASIRWTPGGTSLRATDGLAASAIATTPAGIVADDAENDVSPGCTVSAITSAAASAKTTIAFAAPKLASIVATSVPANPRAASSGVEKVTISFQVPYVLDGRTLFSYNETDDSYDGCVLVFDDQLMLKFVRHGKLADITVLSQDILSIE